MIDRPDKPSPAPTDRAARRAAALRANLQRRKGQARSRAAGPAADGGETPGADHPDRPGDAAETRQGIGPDGTSRNEG
ncbi:hypothetical protein [uncultured Paracoccus sp.]|uniref:hypothetical protein n=1 Tax=uncultured Paracoccus sp. TaxID=189685 RepID=UPI0026375D2D|nr:hypothetical protein [uncultured Paracoccus sp.]